MALQGLRKDCFKMQMKTKSAGPWGEISEKQRGNFRDGIGLCNHYDSELDALGYCRDEDCRYERFIKALQSGEAMKLPNGDIIWMPGVKIRR